MATVPISGLPAGGAAGSADLFASVQSGVTVKVTTTTINTYVNHNIVTPDLGGILYSDATGVAILAHTPTASQVLLSGAADAPKWSTATYPVSTTINQILYSSSNNVIAEIATAANSVLTTNGSGVPSFTSLTSTVVTSATGTANQVLINGVTTLQTGALTFTLPQSIATTSAVQFASLQLDLGTSGTALIVKSGGAGDPGQGGQIQLTNTYVSAVNPNKFIRVDQAGAFQILNSAYSSSILSISDAGLASFTAIDTAAFKLNATPTVNYVLTSDASGNGSWQPVGTGGTCVTTAQGTASQVLVNGTSGTPTSGAITLTTPQDIATSSNVQFARIGINTANSSGALLQVNGTAVVNGTSLFSGSAFTVTQTAGYGLAVTGTTSGISTVCITTQLDTTSTATGLYGVFLNDHFRVQSPNTATNFTELYITGTASGSGTVTNIYGIFVDTMAVSGLTAGHSYGIYVAKPSSGHGGNTTTSLYADDLAIGYTGITPSANGAFIKGASTFGTSTANASAQITTGIDNFPYGLYVAGLTTNVLTTCVGVYVVSVFNPASSTSNTYAGIASTPIFSAGLGSTQNGILCAYYASTSYTSNAGTLVNPIGYYYDGGGAGSGVINIAYGAYFNQPTAGTANVALYSASINLGYAGTNVASGNIIVSGSGSFGSASVTASAILALTSTTQAFLPPRLTTTQRNAISGPATGLVLYNTSTSDIEFYNGAAWIGTSGSGVTTLTGTASQVLVNGTSGTPTSGAITLTTPQNIATTSDVQFKTLGVNSAIGSNALVLFNPTGGNYKYGLLFSGTVGLASNDLYLIVSSAAIAPTTGQKAAAFLVGGSFALPTSGTLTSIAHFSSAIALSGTGTATNSYGVFIDAIAVLSGTPVITNAYGGYFKNPNYGSKATALYADDLCIGYTATTPGAGNALISGKLMVGTTSSTYPFTVIVAGTGPQNAATFQNSDSAPTTSEVRITLGQGGSYYQGLAGKYNSAHAYLGISANSIGDTWNGVASFWYQGGASIGRTYYSVEPPADGLIIQGNVSIGVSSLPSNTGVYISPTLSTSSSGVTLYSASISPTLSFTGTPSTAYATGLFLGYTASIASGTTVTALAGLFINPIGKSGSGTATTAYGAQIFTPTAATTNMAIFAQDIVVGNSNSGTAPPTNGILTQAIQMNTSPAAGYVLTSDGSGNGSWQPCGSGAGGTFYVTDTATDYAITTGDYYVGVTAVGAPFRSIALPYLSGIPYPAPPNGKVYYIKDESGNAATNNIIITVSAPGGGTIEGGVTTYTINTNYGYVAFILDGSTWYIFTHS